jgi:hypothetical protein
MRINYEYGQPFPEKLSFPCWAGASVVNFFHLLAKALHLFAAFPKWDCVELLACNFRLNSAATQGWNPLIF